jgi:DNA-binding protein H-NS
MTIDLTTLSYAELKKLADDTERLLSGRRVEELKVLVNGWKLKADQNGLSVVDVIDEFSKYLPKGGAAKASGGSTSVKGYAKGVVYANPNGAETWVGGTKGRQPPWLREVLAGGKTFEELAVK